MSMLRNNISRWLQTIASQRQSWLLGIRCEQALEIRGGEKRV